MIGAVIVALPLSNMAVEELEFTSTPHPLLMLALPVPDNALDAVGSIT